MHRTTHIAVGGGIPKRLLRSRRGAVLVLAAILMVLMMAFVAFTVDVGYLLSMKTDLKRATDAAALAGAGSLVDGIDKARLEAAAYLVRNPVGKCSLATDDDWQSHVGDILTQYEDRITIQAGHWNSDTGEFTESSELPSTIRVVATQPDVPAFFSGMFRKYQKVLSGDGYTSQMVPIQLQAESIARYQPRDIMLVLDFSASMNDDSEYMRVYNAASADKAAVKTIVEANLLQIYHEFQAMTPVPVYGTLPFTPAYPRIKGAVPTSSALPQIYVTFGTTANGVNGIYVESSKDLSNVVIQTSSGSTQKFDGLSGTTGTFTGTLTATKNKRIVKAWIKSGTNDSGEGPGYGERFEPTTAKIMTAFGLDAVTYPYPAGGWSDFISYCNSSSYVNALGYKYMYGWESLINYWLEQYPMVSQTPDLWKVSAQPVTQLKDSVSVFMDYVEEVDTKDRIGLSVYTAANGKAVLEQGLTREFAAVASIVQRRQAGHHHRCTNIGDGIKYAYNELVANGREGAFKMIVLMTDGLPNLPYNDYGNDYAADKQYALSNAATVAAKHWPIVTVSMGAGADTSLMQSIADATGGLHFNIPGDGVVANYEAQLKAAFRKIADHRPLILVK